MALSGMSQVKTIGRLLTSHYQVLAAENEMQTESVSSFIVNVTIPDVLMKVINR